MSNQSPYITMGEAATELHLSKARISQLLSAGELTGTMVGGRRMVDITSLRDYENRRNNTTSPQRQILTLMALDYQIAQVEVTGNPDNPLHVLEILDSARMPYGTVASTGSVRKRPFDSWWLHRAVPASRPGLIARLAELGIDDPTELPMRSLGLSLSDCYWLKPQDHDLVWADINYFDNNFQEASLDTWDEWVSTLGLETPDNTSEGELPKRWAIKRGVRTLIKGCSSDDQRPYNEVVATALHARLLEQSEYTPYELIHVMGSPASACPNFLGKHEEYVPAALVMDGMRSTRGTNSFERFVHYGGKWLCGKSTLQRFLSQMIVCDAIIANSDRHWRNFGFIRNMDSLAMRPAPLFDSGNCLWFSQSAQTMRAGKWSYASKPFDTNPERQLALVCDLDWYDPSALTGFVDEAIEILSGSESARYAGRLDAIAEGLTLRTGLVTAALSVLRHRL